MSTTASESHKDRLLHNCWTIRYVSNEDLIELLRYSVTDPKDHLFHELGPLFKQTIDEPDVFVLNKALGTLIAYLNAADEHVAARYAPEICDALVAHCLTNRPKATLRKAHIAFMLWVELGAVHAVLDAMEKAIKTQALLPAIDVMFQALSEFGTTIVPPDRIFKILLELYPLQDQIVRASSIRLTLELCRWIGKGSVKSILFEKISDTTMKELEAQLSNVIVAAIPTRKIRFEQVKEPEQQVAAYATRSGPSEDISTPLKKLGLLDKMKSRRWIRRKEAVANLTKLASTKMIALGDFSDVCDILEKRITDRCLSVRVEAVRATGNLSLGLGINFGSYSHILLRALLARLWEDEPIMTEALTNALQSIYKAGYVTLANILKDVKVAVKSKDPHVCTRTLTWVAYCITSSDKAVVWQVHKDYAQICSECLDNWDPEVRDAAFSVLVAIGKSIGKRVLKGSLEKVQYANAWRYKLSKMIGDSGGGAPTVAQHGIMKPGSRRRRRVDEPSEMTQLKNAAQKDLPEETNQLQKMSLSDSQEQKL